MGKAFLGNLTYNQGQEFNVIISDASFDDLSKFNDWAENDANGGNTYNGLGTNIKNSFIVCAPQQETQYDLVSVSYTKSFIDTNKNAVYDDGTDILVSSGSEETTTTPIGTLDTGQYDLLVTDHLGNLIRLTPPFTDIDTDYFAIQEPDLSKSSADSTNTLYNTRALTFNTKYAYLLADTKNVLGNLNATYTPILDSIDKIDATDTVTSSYVTVAYSYITGKDDTGTTNYYWGTFTYDATNKTVAPGGEYDYDKDEDLKDIYSDPNLSFSPHVVSWIGLLRYCDSLQEQVNELNTKMGDVTSALEERIRDLENRNYIWQASSSTPAYLWAGNQAQYSSFIKEKTAAGQNLSSYIFLHQN